MLDVDPKAEHVSTCLTTVRDALLYEHDAHFSLSDCPVVLRFLRTATLC